ncbi:MAG: hypothetical protein JNM09_04595 [Blastocatellia bacterium]|nr:hypothetical protein [Blastocatellia bacterium]
MWQPDSVPDESRLSLFMHELIHVPHDEERSRNQLLTLRNFVRQVNTIPNAWDQIETIVGVSISYLEIRVYDCDEFLRTLKTHGYAVNSWMEKVSRWVGHGHRFDSARALTEHRHEPQLHFVNDRADEEAYGPNYFFVHWDAQSVYAKRGWMLGRIAAGRTHAHHSATPQEVEAYLNGV